MVFHKGGKMKSEEKENSYPSNRVPGRLNWTPIRGALPRSPHKALGKGEWVQRGFQEHSFNNFGTPGQILDRKNYFPKKVIPVEEKRVEKWKEIHNKALLEIN